MANTSLSLFNACLLGTILLLPSAALAQKVVVIQDDRDTSLVRPRYRQVPNFPRTPQEREYERQQRYENVEKELIESHTPPPEPALTRKDLEDILDSKLSDSAKKKPEAAKPEEATSGFGKIGGLGGIGSQQVLGGELTSYEEDNGGFGSIPPLGGVIPPDAPEPPDLPE